MTDYTLHCFAQSGHSYKSAMMLQLSGADWSPVFVDFFNGEARGEAFRALNPMGECPVLTVGKGHDNGLVLTQSGVINDYLTGALSSFRPTSAAERREILRWTLWENHKLSSFLGIWRFLLNFAPKDKVSADVTGFMKGRAMGAMQVLEDHLATRNWVASDQPTTADIGCAGYLFYPHEEYDFGDAEFPAIEAWKDRIRALPHWKHPYDLMPGAPESWVSE